MTLPFVRIGAAVARRVVGVAVVATLGASSLLAQGTTGKLEGTVRDQAGAPIANAQVFIVGTTFSATSNNDGYYFINNVPVGTVTLQASFIGYKATQVAGVRILDGTTLTQDVTLEATPFEVEEITVIAAVNPLVPRDEVTTKQRVDGDYTRNLPVDRVGRVLSLQPGVTGTLSGNTLFIRGGRSDENVLYIDGVPAQAGNRNDVNSAQSSSRSTAGTSSNPGVNTVSVAGFEEASVTTGAASAAFGNAQSGIIAVTTRSGGSAWSGSLSYETDELFSSNTSFGINRVVGSISGPISGGLTFFLGGDIEGRQSAQPGQDRELNPTFVQAGRDTVLKVPSAINDPLADTSEVEVQKWAVYTGTCDEFTGSLNSDIAGNYGSDCRGIRLPGTTRSSWRFNTNLNWSYGTGSRIKASAIFRQNQRRNTVGGTRAQKYPSNAAQWNGDLGENRIFTVNWTQNLSKSAERALALEVGLSYQEDRFLRSPLTRESEASTYSTFGGFMFGKMDFLFNRDNFPIDEQLVANFKSNIPLSRRVPYDIENTDQYRTSSQYRTNPYGLLQGPLWSTSGGPTVRMRVGDENRIVGRATLDWQLDRFNRLKIGGEYIDYKISTYSHSLVSQAFSTAYIQKPIRWNGFVQDRLDL
ncbi:MAG: carboxypeptidase regulatory-like domain-containing protein, partial [Gemmatimonadales bacterium]